jgi:serpin B
MVRALTDWLIASVMIVLVLAAPAMPQMKPAPRQGAKVTSDMDALVKGNNAFAMDLYARLIEGDKNLFCSPYSISTALAMTYGGARGQTAEQMARILHFAIDPAKLHPAFGTLIEDLNTSGKRGNYRMFELVVANAIWCQSGYPFQPAFQELVKAHYGAGLNQVDFEKATERARQTINAWVARQTNDKIKDLIAAGMLNEMTRMVLTNAIYFKSNWADQFEKEATRDEPFHLEGNQDVTVPMMHQQHRMNYMEGDRFQMVEIPYLGHQLSMVVLLPRREAGLAEFEKTLTADSLDKWLDALKSRKVDLSLPRFKTTSQFNLSKMLQAMGMRDAFSPANADFSGMTAAEKMFIGLVIHKAYVDVNEQGTEAAAATAVGMVGTAMPPPEEPVSFKADHPFVYMIRHRMTGSILFVGRLANPKA